VVDLWRSDSGDTRADHLLVDQEIRKHRACDHFTILPCTVWICSARPNILCHSFLFAAAPWLKEPAVQISGAAHQSQSVTRVSTLETGASSATAFQSAIRNPQ